MTQGPYDPNQPRYIGHPDGGPIPPQYTEPPPPPKKSHPWRTAAIVVSICVVLIFGLFAACSALIDGAMESTPPPGEVTRSVAPTTQTTKAPPKAAKVVAPKPADFVLTVKTLSKQCFGSAGCNLTYRIVVAYGGPTLSPSKTYEVTYNVRGGDDGLVTATFTVTGNISSVEEESYISTKNKTIKLSAVATEVSES